MTEKQKEVPLDYEDAAVTVDVFEELNKLSEDETKKLVEVMLLPSEERIEALKAIDDPARIGVYYAAYGRYIVGQRPYAPTPEQLSNIIGAKMAILTTVVADKLPDMYIWALDSSLMADITQNNLIKAVDTAVAMEEKAEKEEAKDYPH